MKAPFIVEGKVAFVEWINPHVVVNVLTDGATDAQRYWLIQIDNPSELLNRGITRNTLESMNTISIKVYQSLINTCSTTCLAYGLSFTDPAGQLILLSGNLEAITSELRFSK